jgi:DNA polymerase-3 subunit gamma/tau
MLTIEAFNALLKTLEEPPAHAIFILATTEAHKIPATILSRCQRFDFKKLTHKEIVRQLSDIANKEKVDIDDKSLSLLASNAAGSSRDGLSLLNQVVSLEDKKITFEETKSILGIPDLSQVINFVDQLISKDARGAIALINDISNSGYDLKQFFKNLLEYFRKLLLVKIDKNLISNEGIDLNDEQLDNLNKQAEKLTPKELVKYIGNFIKAKKEIDDNIIPQLPLEIATIEAINLNAEVDKEVVKEKVVESIKKKEIISERESKSIKNEKQMISKKEENIQKEEKDIKVELVDPTMFSNIKKDWATFIIGVSKNNFTLGSFLKACNPIAIQDGKVVLVCRYSFHKEKLKDLKNKQIMENVAKKLFKAKVIFDLILHDDLSDDLKSKMDDKNSDKLKQQKVATPDLARQALDVFGGNTI